MFTFNIHVHVIVTLAVPYIDTLIVMEVGGVLTTQWLVLGIFSSFIAFNEFLITIEQPL